MNAIDYRIEKIQGNVTKDSEYVALLGQYWQKLETVSWYDAADANSELTHYRWMLEELRVSLFAQPLGTKLPVSAKRIEKQWQKAMNHGN